MGCSAIPKSSTLKFFVFLAYIIKHGTRSLTSTGIAKLKLQGNKGDHFTTFRKDVMLPLTGFMSNNPQQSNRKLWLDPANVNAKEVICPLGCLLGATGTCLSISNHNAKGTYTRPQENISLMLRSMIQEK
ncbi:hypothetical protein C5167_030890 [Papaver somniferum]|nr:hypothetical protein C5167_030890 [Papaver somniferum]